MTYMYELDWTYHESAALLHKKRDFPETVNVELDYCRNQLGCYANYTVHGQWRIEDWWRWSGIPSPYWRVDIEVDDTLCIDPPQLPKFLAEHFSVDK